MISNKQRKENARMRKVLRDEGLLPQLMPKKNTATYLKEVEQLKNNSDIDWFDLGHAVLSLYPSAFIGKKHKFSDEEKAAIKIVHFAILDKQFREQLRAEGKERYSIKEYYDNVYSVVFPSPQFKKSEEVK